MRGPTSQVLTNRWPLPLATVILRCDPCQRVIGELNVNTLHLASELSRLRREHAASTHTPGTT